MIRALVGATVVTLAFAQPVWAQDTKGLPGCFAIVSPIQGIAPSSFLKINKCTGGTWILIRVQLPKARPNEQESYTYRWFPLTHDDTAELNLVAPRGPTTTIGPE